jgi:hypothetical protein
LQLLRTLRLLEGLDRIAYTDWPAFGKPTKKLVSLRCRVRDSFAPFFKNLLRHFDSLFDHFGHDRRVNHGSRILIRKNVAKVARVSFARIDRLLDPFVSIALAANSCIVPLCSFVKPPIDCASTSVSPL